MKSMTGYGRGVQTIDGREFTVEIRSVNNRYLDCSVKLPRSLIFAEDAVKSRIKRSVTRGKVDVFITAGPGADEAVEVTLNRPVLEGYLRAMAEMAKDYQVKDDVSISTLARLPEVFLMDKPKQDEDQLLAAILQVEDQALAAYDAMRTAEGTAMEADLRGRMETILSLVAQVEAGSPPNRGGLSDPAGGKNAGSVGEYRH